MMSKFSEAERKEIIERIKLRIESDKQDANALWGEAYEQYSIETRKELWLRKIWRDMRWQGESAEDEFDIFTVENYLLWKQKESEIDLILEYVSEELDEMYAGNGEIAKKIKSRLFKN